MTGLQRVLAGAAVVLALAGTVGPARAEVLGIEVTSRQAVLGGQAFGDAGPYEYLEGRVHLALDPADPHNAVIVDLDRAPRNADGLVEVWADLAILAPRDRARGNGTVLFDVLNRGRKRVLSVFGSGAGGGTPTTAEEIGDGLLLRRGFTLVWVGWEFDVPVAPGLMRIDAPPAQGVTGLVRAALVAADASATATFGDLRGYRPADPASPRNTLSVVDFLTGAPVREVPRERWRLEGNTVTLDGGFEPGVRYELAYEAVDPPVAGTGFAAVRDAIAWMRHSPDAPVTADRAIAYGSSQSGRFLRTFLYLGFNTDEAGRAVFDGVMPHIAGSSRLDLNRRWAATTSLGVYTATAFPFADASLVDPVSGARDGLLAPDRVGPHRPKVMYTNTGVEYWGGGRVAALVHTAPDGSADLELPDDTRVYFIAGTQHSPAGFPPMATTGAALNNPTNYRWAMRALLMAMDRWVRDGTPPPPSRYPRLSDGTLVPAAEVVFPRIPGVGSPQGLVAGVRVANDRLAAGGAAGARLPLLVPQVDADGNETSGILLPDVAVPVATLTGWNFRDPAIGASDQLFPLLGSFVPFPRTEADRERTGDPRPSIARRYASREEYLGRVGLWTASLVQDGYVLAEDLDRIDAEAAARWDWLMGGAR